MSFDWLNIPGLENSEINFGTSQESTSPPPNVSFDFGSTPTVNVVKEQDRRSILDYGRSQSDSSIPTEGSGKGKDVQSQHPNHYRIPQHHHDVQRQIHPQTPEQQDHLQQRKRQVQNREGDAYKESSDDLRVPLSLSRSQLTKEEVRTYLRWYNYITARTHGKLVKLADVFKFLSNFNITEELKVRIHAIFRTCKSALNIGQFFAVLRLISKALLEGIIPIRRMILEKAPIPQPRPILSSGDRNEVYEEVDEDEEAGNNGNNGQKVDFDSFASLLLTGKSMRKRIKRKITNGTDRNKRVRFSEQLTFQEMPTEGEGELQTQNEDTEDVDEANQANLDLSLPMDQLLRRIAKSKKKNSALVSSLPNEQQETEEEKQVLEDMKDSLSHFKQIQTVDFASVSANNVPSITLNNNDTNGDGFHEQSSQASLQPLKPTSTGSANYLFRQEYNQASMTDLSEQPIMEPLKPTATGSANYLVRSHFGPAQQSYPERIQNEVESTHLPGGLQPLKPTATGSGNYLMKQQFNQQLSGGSMVSPAASPDAFSSPQHTGQVTNIPNLQAPQPHLPLQQQISPQVTPQTQQNLFSTNIPQHQNMLSAPNPASNYFHALLSNSPSPSPSNLNLPAMNNNTSPYQAVTNGHIPTSQSRAIYNSGYQYSSPVQNQQQQLFNNTQQQQQHQQQHQQMLHPQRFGNSNGTLPSQGSYGMPLSNSPRNGDILGDLQSLQQQVDALQNAYGRR